MGESESLDDCINVARLLYALSQTKGIVLIAR